MFRRRLKQAWFTRNLPQWIDQLQEQSAWVILCYHRFESEEGLDPIPGMAVTPDAFRKQIEFLRSIGTLVSLEEGLVGGEGLRFSLTFDDGYRDNVDVLLPEIKKRSVPVTVYCTSDFIAGCIPQLDHDDAIGYTAPAMNPEQLRVLAASPLVTIGAHSVTHPRFTKLVEDEWVQELGQAKTDLESWIERPVEHFAYTYGPLQAFDWAVGPGHVAQAGYRSLASNAGGCNPSSFASHRPVHLRRVPSIASDERNAFLGWVIRNALH